MHKDIEKILEAAGRSPSSHNTQPWQVNIKDRSLMLGYDPGRHLTVGDPEKRELFMSLGCYLESIVLAAGQLGYDTEVRYLEKDDPKGVATVSLVAATPSNQDWIRLIQARSSDRRAYDPTPLSPELIAEIQKAKYETAGIRLYTAPEEIDFLAEGTKRATETLMSPPPFRQELASWVRNNWTRRPDGMPGYTQGMPGPVSLLAKVVIRNNPKVARQQAKKDSDRVRHSAAVGLVCVHKNNFRNWLAAGRVYQQACLTALRGDVHSAAVSAAVIDPATAQDTSERLSLPGTPVALVRFGYKNGTVRPTHRRPLSDVVAAEDY